jgi:hypothetical protein
VSIPIDPSILSLFPCHYLRSVYHIGDVGLSDGGVICDGGCACSIVNLHSKQILFYGTSTHGHNDENVDRVNGVCLGWSELEQSSALAQSWSQNSWGDICFTICSTGLMEGVTI